MVNFDPQKLVLGGITKQNNELAFRIYANQIYSAE